MFDHGESDKLCVAGLQSESLVKQNLVDGSSPTGWLVSHLLLAGVDCTRAVELHHNCAAGLIPTETYPTITILKTHPAKIFYR